MVAVITTAAFHGDVLCRALIVDTGSLLTWATPIGPAGGRGAVDIRPRLTPDVVIRVDPTVVERGIRRIQGGQNMARPVGVTMRMLIETNMADGQLDAEQMSPATANAVIQVGLFGKVLYP